MTTVVISFFRLCELLVFVYSISADCEKGVEFVVGGSGMLSCFSYGDFFVEISGCR